MIATAYSVAYLLMSVLSVFVGFVAVAVGITVLRRWHPEISSEEQYALEKRVYLIITAIMLGVGMRLVMVPLWFWTVTSYIPLVPGAMCMAGIHMLRMPYSFIATGFKFFLPLLYIFWLVINTLDRKMETQPLMTFKLKALIPLGLFMLAETYLDILFLTAVEPRKVSCCTSLFDMPTEAAPQVMVSEVWLWYGIFWALSAVLIGVSVAMFKKGRYGLAVLVTPIALFDMAAFILALHTKVSPLFLHAPFHHCVFCVWQNLWDGALFSSLVIVSVWFSLIYAWVYLIARRRKEVADIAAPTIRGLSLASVLLLSLGLVIIGIHTLVAG